MKKTFIIILLIIIAVVVAAIIINKKESKKNNFRLVPVKLGEVTVKAIAIGQIVPKEDISIKSKIRGILKKKFVKVGDIVEINAPLMEVNPDPTPVEFMQAKRKMEIAKVAMDNAETECIRSKQLHENKWASQQEYDDCQQLFDESKLRFDMAKENFDLISKGTIELAGQKIDNIIRSPINGTVLEFLVDQGDPIVPLTSFQEGTPLMTVANMNELIFKGTVDEIDIGKIEEGVPAKLKAGALPDCDIEGMISEISPKAKMEENATLFGIEIKIVSTNSLKLRAGYSATAKIIIDQTNNVLTIPERLIFYSNDMSYVEVQLQNNETEIRLVKTKLSDGITTEIESGLKENEKVIERPPKERN